MFFYCEKIMRYIILDVIQNDDYIEDIKFIGLFFSNQEAVDYINNKHLEAKRQSEDVFLYIKTWIKKYVPDNIDYPIFWKNLFKSHTQYTFSVFQNTQAYPPNFENTLMNYLRHDYEKDKQKGAELNFDFYPPNDTNYFSYNWRIVEIPVDF